MKRGVLAILCIALLVWACGERAPGPASEGPPGPCNIGARNHIVRMSTPPAMCIDAAKSYQATVRTAKGSFTIALDAKAAPVTVNNFVTLGESRFYDGLKFHRVVPGFVVQGGDPAGDGTGGPAYKLPPEKAGQDWTAGAVGMAASPAGVNGSQFFVLLGDAPHLASGTYNRFGRVDSGMDVVRKLAIGDRIVGVDVTAT